jgi:hypothetical protein
VTLPALDQLPPVDTQRGGDPALLFAELKAVIADAITAHPRSQQKRIGPSEIGETCARKLAYKVTGTPEARTLPPGWRPTVGTATHAWLEEAFIVANGEPARWLLETRIDAGTCAGQALTGSSDAYDRVTATVIDWKVVGPSSMKKYGQAIRAGRAPRADYRIQGHTYGLGFTRRGLPVDTVAIVFLPSAGELDDALMWSEPYDPQVALDAMKRVDRIHALASTLGLAGALPMTNRHIRSVGADLLADPDTGPDDLAIGTDADSCRFCPWHVPASTDLATACPGDAGQIEASAARVQAQAADPFALPTQRRTK